MQNQQAFFCILFVWQAIHHHSLKCRGVPWRLCGVILISYHLFKVDDIHILTIWVGYSWGCECLNTCCQGVVFINWVQHAHHMKTCVRQTPKLSLYDEAAVFDQYGTTKECRQLAYSFPHPEYCCLCTSGSMKPPGLLNWVSKPFCFQWISFWHR